jgi:hypothetical protein
VAGESITELGATHYHWRADVSAIVQEVLARYPHVSANTYVGHPWEGWSHVSVDFWGEEGRGWPISMRTALNIRKFLMNLNHGPKIRHTILGHTLWTSFGGTSWWAKNDHSGDERHLHVTYWL